MILSSISGMVTKGKLVFKGQIVLDAELGLTPLRTPYIRDTHVSEPVMRRLQQGGDDGLGTRWS